MTFFIGMRDSWTWIPTYECAQCNRTKYTQLDSDTFQRTSKRDEIPYGRGSIKGYVGKDSFSLDSEGEH